MLFGALRAAISEVLCNWDSTVGQSRKYGLHYDVNAILAHRLYYQRGEMFRAFWDDLSSLRHRRGCGLGCERRGKCGRGDHRDTPANQFDCQLRHSIELTFGEAIRDRHILALDIAGVSEALAECA